MRHTTVLTPFCIAAAYLTDSRGWNDRSDHFSQAIAHWIAQGKTDLAHSVLTQYLGYDIRQK